MSVRIFSGGQRIESIPADDRGLAYGDGIFETMRAHGGELPWWDAHWQRLAHGAQRLGFPAPRQALVREQAQAMLEGGDGVLKLLVTRGSGARGYAPGVATPPTWVLSLHSLPPAPAQGLCLRWCQTRLSLQPALAGLKHCNRLEQVLARAEWNGSTGNPDPADEGLMRSTEGDVVCATAANLFVLQEGRWTTPPVDRCGVAGVCRGWLLAHADVREKRLSVTDVETAQAVFLCNAVRGILPVARLGAARTWPAHPLVAELQARLADAHPGFGRH
ncbi:aminodeoxychorismate lyase [Agrilutibacter solisilvae]|uniref:Aminodeoxychorismate lyase n=1 Tax=Agrilutibacter solisilvae TaxID=2763317 RepID=A0A975AS00_9GAMM|nr:aminodeoxychorismate lyase [Lysobacter solisilvae]QSX78247.1 aminodeoxychorismate lyase [Lysobacter solisilvae]